MLTDTFENFGGIFFEEVKFNPRILYLYLNTWGAWLKYTKTDLENIQETDSLLISLDIIRCGLSGCLGKRSVVSAND